MSNENEIQDVRFAFIYDGVVVENEDPEGLGRVRLRIPGLIDEKSAWAFPVGSAGGGSKQRGFKFTPLVGAEVACYFRGGDPDQPRYFPGHWGKPNAGTEMLTDMQDLSKEDAPFVNGIETDRYKITIDDRPGKENLKISDKNSGDSIEFDGSTKTGPGMIISASAALIIKVDGMVTIDGSSIILNGRKISDGSANI